ncbi:uncharacterized protein [Dysidea avara]|uniref:uncharacterized protein n=1 Tax=Dysidea avara TaxID=196820 RepID=UPI003327114B
MNDCSPPSPTPPPETAGKPSESFLLTYQENYISRDTDGSYIVRFPWKENYPLLPSNLAICDRDPALTDLCAVLLRFRLHCYALSTDIEKAFLHVKLDSQDRDFTRFLWLADPTNPESLFISYRFKVVLFGSVSFPFMLNATLDLHLKSFDSPVSHDMKKNLYVDNIISGCQSEEEILQYYTESRAIMSDAKFNLRLWASNSPKLQEQAQRDNTLDADTTVNRSVLQASSKQYDPLGWLSPITVRAKLLMQELWKQQVRWDEPLEDDFIIRWSQVAADIEGVAGMVMTRRYSVMCTNQCVYLHVFADASLKAYGAVAYLQSADQVDLLMAKSRVSPLKDTTLPRLELRAAVIAAHLAKFIVSTLQSQLGEVNIRLWSDSQITLHWIFSSKQLKPFVANRVKDICSLFPTSVWGYCHTEDNAADLLTRGITPSQLCSSSLWSRGPAWLTTESDWPQWSPSSILHVNTDEEVESTTAVMKTATVHKPGVNQCIDISSYSTLTKLYRITAYVLRFITNLKATSSKVTGPLTATELNQSQKLWITATQQEIFSNELTNLQSKSSPRLPLVHQLRLYLNKQGIVLCANKLCGSHYKAPNPPPLPKHRVQMMEPFTVTGIDFTGALYIRAPEGENKVYVCLFTCASTRAVHLEVVTDLSEETFLQAFRRFSSRKSLPRFVLSDNASTFMSAADDLKALFESTGVQESLGNQGVEWRFIPHRAPWYGGYWERLVGLTKNAIKKTLGRAFVTLSSLQTLIVEIETHLNNRPLTYASTDHNDPEPLTPSHILYGRIINTVPHSLTDEEELSDENFQEAGQKLHHTLSKKAKTQALIIQHFWSRWKKEYLTSLRETHTTNTVVQELQRGNDSLVRSATIRTANGFTNRPISKLYPLEVNAGKNAIEDDNDDQVSTPEAEPLSSSRPPRSAAVKARMRVSEWSKILRGPEDVMN